MNALQSPTRFAFALSAVVFLSSAGCESTTEVSEPDPRLSAFPQIAMPTDEAMEEWSDLARDQFERLRPIADELNPLFDVAQRRHLTDQEFARVLKLVAQMQTVTRSAEFQAIRKGGTQ